MLSLSNRSWRSFWPVIISNGEFHLNPVFLLNTTQTQVQNSDIYIDKITKLKGLLSHWVEILGGELLLGLYQFYFVLLGLASLSGARRGYMPPQLKNPIIFFFKNDSLNTTSTQYLTEGKSVSSTGFLLEFKEFCWKGILVTESTCLVTNSPHSLLRSSF